MLAVEREALARRTAQAITLTGMSQRAVALQIGVSAAFLSQVASNKSLPSIQLVVGLREHFNISLEWYLLGHGEPLVEGEPATTPSTQDITYELLPAVLALGPNAQAQLRGYLHSMIDAATQGQRHAQTG